MRKQLIKTKKNLSQSHTVLISIKQNNNENFFIIQFED